MAQEVLTWPNSQLKCLCSFQVSRLLIHLGICIPVIIPFTSRIKDVAFVLIYM